MASREKFNIPVDLFSRPIPPFEFKQLFDETLLESKGDDLRRVSAHNRIRGNILRYHRSRRDNGAAANREVGHDDASYANPHIVTYRAEALGFRLVIKGARPLG